MGQRNLFLICYDISCPKRLSQVHRYLLGFKVGGQKSFFECWLTQLELRDCQQNLAELINQAEDRVHIFQLDPRMHIDLFGTAQRQVINSAFLIL